jgi:hypothetical protein
MGECPVEPAPATPVRAGHTGQIKTEVAGTDPNAKYKRRRRWHGGYRKGGSKVASASRCAWCGRPSGPPTVDHIAPWDASHSAVGSIAVYSKSDGAKTCA